MDFSSWLHTPDPEWKTKLDTCDPRLFDELELKKEEVSDILEKLSEYNVL